jgi:hypothetical protein
MLISPTTAASIDEALQQNREAQKNHMNPKHQIFSSCAQKGDQPAFFADAAECVQELTARRVEGQYCDVSSTIRSQCRRRFAQIVVTVKPHPDQGPTSMNCNDITRAVALIMDRCTTDILTVTGESNMNSIAVRLQEPLFLQSSD